MHIRWNTTNKYWESSVNMSVWSPLEENNAFDGDRKFGSNLTADIDGDTSLRHFTFDGNSKIAAAILVGATAASTASLVGIIGVHNRGSASADKRLASFNAFTDGAQNSGRLTLATSLLGVLNSRFHINKDGDVGVGLDPLTAIEAGGTNIKRFNLDGGTLVGQLGIGMTQAGTANEFGRFIFFNKSIVATDKRIVVMSGFTDGATNTGKLQVSIMDAGTSKTRLAILGSGTFIVNPSGVLATNATGGFLAIPQCAGAPTGAPAGLSGVSCAVVYDTTNNKLWVWNSISSLWKGVVLA